jgi:flagellar motor switch protein FliN/FliY
VSLLAEEDPQSELEALYEVEIDLMVVLGSAMMPISQVLKLGRGAVVELDRTVDEDIEIYGNGRIVGHGEVTVVNEMLGITVTDIIKTNIG